MTLPNTGDTNWGIPLNNYINGLQTAVSSHAANIPADPHGDRAYATSLVSPITSGVNAPNGFVKLGSTGTIANNLFPVGAIKSTFWDAQRDGGAAGNGSSDDTAAIQKVLTLAANAGGGEVWVPAGTYKLTSQLIIGAGTWLHLAPGAFMVRKAAPGKASPSWMIGNADYWASPPASTAAGSFIISGGVWDATGYTIDKVIDSSACVPMLFVGTSFAQVTQTEFISVSGSNSIRLLGCTGVTIEEIEFSGTQAAAGGTVPAVALYQNTTAHTPSGLAPSAYDNSVCNNILVRGTIFANGPGNAYPPANKLIAAGITSGDSLPGVVVVTENAISDGSNLASPVVDFSQVNYGQAYGNTFLNGWSGHAGNWQTLTLEHGWTGAVAYKLGVDGVVFMYIDGLNASSVISSSNASAVIVGTLPARYTPSAAVNTGPLVYQGNLVLSTTGNYNTPFLAIGSDGTVVMQTLHALPDPGVKFFGTVMFPLGV